MSCRANAHAPCLLVLLLVALGCGHPDGAMDAELRASLEEVPEPGLEDVEASVREQIEQRQADLRSALDPEHPESGSTAADLAAAYGELASIYHAYEFLVAADPAYSNARRLAPDIFRWAYLQALLRDELGRKDEALAALDAALDLDPDHVTARVRRASLLKDLGNPEAARQELETLLAERPDLALAHYLLAQLAADRGDWQQAATGYERVLDLQPGASRVRYPLSRIYQRLGRGDEAQAQAARAGSADVTLADPILGQLEELKRGAAALVRRGAVAQIEGDWQSAAAAYRDAVAADPQSVEARMSLGGALVELGDLEGAEEQLRRAVEIDAEQALAWFNLAGVLRAQGRFDESMAAYDRAIEISPDETRFLLARAQTLIDAGRPGPARLAYESILAADPDSADAAFGLATLTAAEGDVRGAIRQVETLLARDLEASQRRLASLRLAGWKARVGRVGEALALYEQVLAGLDADTQQPGERAMAVDAHFGRANLLGAAGRFREAATAYDSVTALAPTRAEAWLGAATALALAGDWRDAREHLETGIQSSDDKSELRHALARLLATAPSPEVRDGELALELARAALAAGGSVDQAETVGMALAELGRWQEAVDWQSRVVDQLTSAGEADRAARARALLDRYRNRQPIRQGATP